VAAGTAGRYLSLMMPPWATASRWQIAAITFEVIYIMSGLRCLHYFLWCHNYRCLNCTVFFQRPANVHRGRISCDSTVRAMRCGKKVANTDVCITHVNTHVHKQVTLCRADNVINKTYFDFEMTTFPTSSPALAFFQHSDIYLGTYKYQQNMNSMHQKFETTSISVRWSFDNCLTTKTEMCNCLGWNLSPVLYQLH